MNSSKYDEVSYPTNINGYLTTSGSTEDSIFKKILDLAMELDRDPDKVAKRFKKLVDIVYGID